MKPKTFFIIILTLAIFYLLYYFITLPEKKFGEIKVENSKFTSEIKKTPTFVFKTSANLFNKNILVYKIDKKMQSNLSAEQAKDIANVLKITNTLETIDLNQNKFFTFKTDKKNLSISDYGFIQYSEIISETNQIFNKNTIVEIIKNSNLNKIVPLTQNYNFEINNIESDGFISDKAKYITIFSIAPMIDKPFTYRGNLEQNIYYGTIKPIVDNDQLTSYQIEINTWYSIVFDTLESSTYKTISLDKALQIIKETPDKVFVEIDSKEVHNPVIDTNILDITKVDIVYFVQDKMLIPYFHFQGLNEFNQTDKGVVNIYVPAI